MTEDLKPAKILHRSHTLTNTRLSNSNSSATTTEKSPRVHWKNTDREMHPKNLLYQTLCLYCEQNEKFLVSHYAQKHPEYEIPISRPTPEMAKKLREQVAPFQTENGKIEGICYFCDVTKNITKHHWTSHLLKHTGELMFFCMKCEGQFKTKNSHKDCPGEPINVFNLNSLDASLAGYMCKDCNYLQYHFNGMRKHLINEHGYETIVESQHYEKMSLIPDLTPVHSRVSLKYGFVDITVRFQCTICQKNFVSADAFTGHFDEYHTQIDKYKCFCGEVVERNDHMFGKSVVAHLQMHNADLYQCKVCTGVYLRKCDVRNHILNEHPETGISYQHACRNPSHKQFVSEETIHKFTCNNCKKKSNGNFEIILNHCKEKHPTKTVDVTALVYKKVTDSKTTKFTGGTHFHVRFGHVDTLKSEKTPFF